MVKAAVVDKGKDRDVRGHGTHIWICGALVLAALLIALISGKAVAYVPVIGCVLMMVVMMQMMGSMGGRDNDGRK